MTTTTTRKYRIQDKSIPSFYFASFQTVTKEVKTSNMQLKLALLLTNQNLILKLVFILGELLDIVEIKKKELDLKINLKI